MCLDKTRRFFWHNVRAILPPLTLVKSQEEIPSPDSLLYTHAYTHAHTCTLPSTHKHTRTRAHTHSSLTTQVEEVALEITPLQVCSLTPHLLPQQRPTQDQRLRHMLYALRWSGRFSQGPSMQLSHREVTPVEPGAFVQT